LAVKGREEGLFNKQKRKKKPPFFYFYVVRGVFLKKWEQ
jgi:hypothetical protein